MAALAVVALVVAAAAGPAAAAGTTQAGASPSFVVELADDGSATVTLTLTYDLETGDERTAFRTLRNDSDARTDARDRFASRMASVASDASRATGRDMSVTDAAIELSLAEDGSVGVVALSVEWSNLAAVDGDRLVVTEPFASGFEPDREFTVRGPEGYELADASPAPNDQGDAEATWAAGTDLSGFQVVFAATADGTGTATEASGGGDGSDAGDGSGDGGGVGTPGFGAGVALVALLAAALAVARRR